jgi:hypothetical protein
MMNKRGVLSLCISLVAVAPLIPADAAPLLVDTELFDGHVYEIYKDAGIGWTTANANATSLSKQGVTGHLATITSSAEDAFLETLRNGAPDNLGEVWVGGLQGTCATTPTPGCGWAWVNGEGAIAPNNAGLTFANWQAGEPNDHPDNIENGAEQHLAIGLSDLPGWNDEGSLGNISGYIVEYDIPINAAGCIGGSGCQPFTGQNLTLPPVAQQPGDDLIGIRRFEYTDPRVALGKCGRDSLTLSIAGNDLVIPPYLCGSPKFIVVKTEPTGFQILRGTITVVNDLAQILPGNQNALYGDCDLPAGDVDQQHRAVMVWQATNSSQMLESAAGSGFVSPANGYFLPGAAAGEFSDHCSPSRGLTRSGSFFVIGMHIDFGVPWTTSPKTVFMSFVALTRYKLELLAASVEASKGVLKNGDFTKLRQQAGNALKALDRGNYATALTHMENFMKFVQAAAYANDPAGFNHNGEHLARGQNVVFMLRDKVLPAVQ